MSIEKQNITIPDLLRTFERNSDKYKLTEGLFIHADGFTFTDEEFEDADFWYANIGINLFPLHGVTDFAPEDRKNTQNESIQDFTYTIGKPKYRHRVKFDWSLDYHQLVNALSGQTLRGVYYSDNVLRAVRIATDVIQGFLFSAFELEPLAFTTSDSVGNSELFLELNDSDELNVNGYEVEVDWEPSSIDRLVLNINLSFGEDTISMLIKYLNNKISGISSSDITITDAVNGNITFSTFVPGDGTYLLSGFSGTMTNACMYIKSTLYIGVKKFTFVAVVQIITNRVWENDDNRIWENDDNALFEN